jgi:DNA-binding CsgD family transcriptional regulator
VSAALLAQAILCNGLGRHEDALDAADAGSAHPEDLCFHNWSLVELVEAAGHSRQRPRAADAVERLAERTGPSGSDWARGVEARSRALVSEGDEADRLHRAAIAHLGRTKVRVELARAHLLYGEWLRRERRRADARQQLRRAHDMLTAMGLEGFAQRARRELMATGETARRRTVGSGGQLTVREAQIARLARDGLSNPEIGTRLFLSPRTVEYHLGKVFTKLGISSRTDLHRVLEGPPARPRGSA